MQPPTRKGSTPGRACWALLVALATAGLAGACAGSSQAHHAVLTVPAQYPTIQAAVNRAKPGDLVLISPGVYHEAVVSHVPDLVIRGVDRNTVVLDGRNKLTNGIAIAAAGDAVENLTVRNYAVNGVLFTLLDGYGSGPSLHGYRASYVTAYDNGLYGLYAFGAIGGQLDHDDASGQPDSGIYVGQCRPCNVVVEDDTAEANRVGFEAANASGGLTVIDSRFDQNRVGVVVESDNTELLLPQVGAVVAGNVVADNDNPDTPTSSGEEDVFGYGIAIGGGSHDQVLRNRVTGNSSVGIIVTDESGYNPTDNTVSGNAVVANRVDLVYVLDGTQSAPIAGNCFSDNVFATSEPSTIDREMACDQQGSVTSTFEGLPSPDGVDYSTIARPALQGGMTDPLSAPADPATNEPPTVDLSQVALPGS
jgi:parallel beta-helix repeat protein